MRADAAVRAKAAPATLVVVFALGAVALLSQGFLPALSGGLNVAGRLSGAVVGWTAGLGEGLAITAASSLAATLRQARG